MRNDRLTGCRWNNIVLALSRRNGSDSVLDLLWDIVLPSRRIGARGHLSIILGHIFLWLGCGDCHPGELVGCAGLVVV